MFKLACYIAQPSVIIGFGVENVFLIRTFMSRTKGLLCVSRNSPYPTKTSGSPASTSTAFTPCWRKAWTKWIFPPPGGIKTTFLNPLRLSTCLCEANLSLTAKILVKLSTPVQAQQVAQPCATRSEHMVQRNRQLFCYPHEKRPVKRPRFSRVAAGVCLQPPSKR